VSWWLAASRYDASPAFAARNDNMALYGLFARLFTSTPFARPLIDSPRLAQALGLLLVALLIGAFARAVPRAGSDREGRLQLGKPAPTGQAGSNREGWLSLHRAALTLVEASFVLLLGMSYGPYTERGHLVLLLPGLVGCASLAAWWWTERAPGAAWWAWAAVAWAVPLGLQASPLKNGNAGFNAAWVRGDLAALLWSGAYGALLLGVGLLTMAILRRERALSSSL